MQTIVQLTKIKTEHYLLTFASGETLEVTEDVLVNYRLLKGQTISDAQLKEIQASGSLEAGFQKALSYLDRQLRTTQEVRTYLVQKGVSSQLVPEILARLAQLQVLDDAAFSESYVRTMMRLSDKGPRMIAQQLKAKGISETLIQQALTLFTESEQMVIATKICEKAIGRYQDKSAREAMQKMQTLLYQKGFDATVIEVVLQEISFADEEIEQEALAKQGARLWQRHRALPVEKRVQKVKQALYQKGFQYDLIVAYLNEKELEDDE